MGSEEEVDEGEVGACTVWRVMQGGRGELSAASRSCRRLCDGGCRRRARRRDVCAPPSGAALALTAACLRSERPLVTYIFTAVSTHHHGAHTPRSKPPERTLCCRKTRWPSPPPPLIAQLPQTWLRESKGASCKSCAGLLAGPRRLP